MNDPSDDSSLRLLLEVVERDLQQRRRAILEDASTRARKTVHAARSRARQRVHQAVKEERERIRAEVERATAAHAVRARERRQEALRSMLDGAWAELPGALRSLWEDPEAQKSWVAALVAHARHVMMPGPLRIEHPPGFDPEPHAGELEALGTWAAHEAQLVMANDLDAGLRVHAGGACLDGSVEGLLADQRAVEGRLLTELLDEEDANRGGEP